MFVGLLLLCRQDRLRTRKVLYSRKVFVRHSSILIVRRTLILSAVDCAASSEPHQTDCVVPRGSQLLCHSVRGEQAHRHEIQAKEIVISSLSSYMNRTSRATKFFALFPMMQAVRGQHCCLSRMPPTTVVISSFNTALLSSASCMMA